MSPEKQAIAKDRSSRRNWTEEEKDLVWEQACQAKENDLPLTEAFRQISKLLPHRSEAAIGMLYYNVLRKEREGSEPVAKPSKSVSQKKTREFKIDADLIEAFQGLPEYIHQVNKRIEVLEKQVEHPNVDSIIMAIAKLADKYQDSNNLQQQLESLQKENAKLREENKTLSDNIARIEQAYDDATGVYEMFTNMASISQIMSLGDFKQQMKTTLDKWGNVLDVSFERSVTSEGNATSERIE